MLRTTLRWRVIPSRKGVPVILVASYYAEQDKHTMDGPLSSSTVYYIYSQLFFPSATTRLVTFDRGITMF